MNPDLTPRQAEFLQYLEKRIAGTGKAPSLRQAAEDTGVSHAAVAQLIRALEEKGVIRREGRYGRVIHLLNAAGEKAGTMRWREVPVIGTIAAGLPLYAQQEWAGSLVVDSGLYKGQNLFALKITGDSMKDAAILDGDMVICEPRQFAQNGEIVVALIHQEEATVKRFFHRETHIELRPENPAYAPMTYAFNEVLIQGKVIGLVREL
ncbi:MAG: transcriptional repressor LexA [Proteobacteria bacterium]|nr:transcriptional repressor LexA [Pseudomonadota bacterium]MBU4471031.1 transcriptional repressor LexA [Pseudomonadota bacterium]MCG2753631.1 transcriptional repressor LexA [Desulfobacteraceae bacterium]